MRRLLLLVPLLAACSTLPPRPMPAADWSRGAVASVRPDVEKGSWTGVLKPHVENDLRSAGFVISERSNAEGQLDLVLSADVDTVVVVVVWNGLQVDRFNVDFQQLPCVGNMTVDPACVGREIAARLLESQAVAKTVGASPKPAVAAAAPSRKLSGKLAVLELRNFAPDLTPQNARYFTDLVRSAALKAQPQLQIMTRENLLVLLQASGKDLANCEGECEVDTGRRIGADSIVSGELQKLGSLYKLSLRLHDTHEGRLLASTQASGKSVEELDQGVQKAAEELLR